MKKTNDLDCEVPVGSKYISIVTMLAWVHTSNGVGVQETIDPLYSMYDWRLVPQVFCFFSRTSCAALIFVFFFAVLIHVNFIASSDP